MEPFGSVFCTLYRYFRIGSRKRTRANTRATDFTLTYRAWGGDRAIGNELAIREEYSTVLCSVLGTVGTGREAQSKTARP